MLPLTESFISDLMATKVEMFGIDASTESEYEVLKIVWRLRSCLIQVATVEFGSLLGLKFRTDIRVVNDLKGLKICNVIYRISMAMILALVLRNGDSRFVGLLKSMSCSRRNSRRPSHCMLSRR